MYKGEVNISQDRLEIFLHTAEALKIKGITCYKWLLFVYLKLFPLLFSSKDWLINSNTRNLLKTFLKISYLQDLKQE